MYIHGQNAKFLQVFCDNAECGDGDLDILCPVDSSYDNGASCKVLWKKLNLLWIIL